MNKKYLTFVLFISLAFLVLAVIFPYFGVPFVIFIGLSWEPILSKTIFKKEFVKDED